MERAQLQITNSGIIFLTLSVQPSEGTMTDAREWARARKATEDAKRNTEKELHERVSLQRDIEAEKMPQL